MWQKKEIKLYLFLSNISNSSPGTVVNPTSSADGLFYQLNASTKPPEPNVAITEVIKGDGRLILVYTGLEIEDFYKTLVCDVKNAAHTPSACLASADFIGLFDPVSQGELMVKPLTNGTSYTLALGQVNKFRMSSTLVNASPETPELIQAFLESKSCYFFSAGFKHDHYVLDFLRDFRDKILLNTIPGKLFVQWYYATAPQYAMTIYHSSFLSFFIRSIGYVLFFAFYSVPCFLFLTPFFLFKKKKK